MSRVGNDILSSLLIGIGGTSKEFGLGLRQRQQDQADYMNKLQSLYYDQLLRNSDPYRQRLIKHMDWQESQPRYVPPRPTSEMERMLDEIRNAESAKLPTKEEALMKAGEAQRQQLSALYNSPDTAKPAQSLSELMSGVKTKSDVDNMVNNLRLQYILNRTGGKPTPPRDNSMERGRSLVNAGRGLMASDPERARQLMDEGVRLLQGAVESGQAQAFTPEQEKIIQQAMNEYGWTREQTIQALMEGAI